jgi:Domain of Unknown Function (DUF1080)
MTPIMAKVHTHKTNLKIQQSETLMNRPLSRLFSSFAITFALAGCAHNSGQSAEGWVSLLSGEASLANWNILGDANWRLVDGAIQADKGTGFLVSKNTYKDFQIKAEFWADADANSGIFIRLSDTKTVTAANSYEVNIYDKRPDPLYGTGAIVDFAKVSPMPKAAGKWNTYEITAKGAQLTVVLNGQKTVDIQDSKFSSGPIALQYAPGVVKDSGTIRFRQVQIRAL